MKKRMLVIFLILIQLTGILYAQTEAVEKTKIIYKGGKIEFQNSKNGVVEHVYDIEENNPYRNEPFPMNENRQSYDMTGATLADFLLNISEYDEETVARLNRSMNYASISGTPYKKSLKNISITYDFVVWNRNNSSVYAKSTIVVLNNKGEITHTFDPNFSVAMQAITDDGKYLCVAYTNTDRAITQEKGIGIRIYDLKSKSVLSDKWIDQSGTVFVRIKNKMGIVTIDANTYYYFYVVDFENKKSYYKEFTREERHRLQVIKKEGLVFGQSSISDSKHYEYYYEKDFEMEEF
ncbi:MAG: hypothetical protein KAS53_05200 [Candidatus Cloacimonetes bacterium]|nr:hypothetical protein [Candidatus Cloacimonadota bacterium]